ncbi:MAG: hypothetical protein JST55_04305 [Bacteroidetes bacterium]|nr:hypothetical protein [Bacteroidota bacterium]
MKLSNSFQNSNMNSKDKYWQKLKEGNHDNTFPKVEVWLNNLNSEKSQSFNLNGIQTMKNFFALNKFKLVYSVLILAVVFAACNMPVTQNKTIGNALNWKVSKTSKEAIEKINSLPWIDKSKLSVQEQTSDDKSFLTYSLILDNKSSNEMQNYMKELQKIPSVNSVQLFPLNQTTKLPLYAAALHSFFRVESDATNKSDAEVTNELQKQLNAAGIEDIKVGYKTMPDGQRMLDVQPTEKGLNRKEGDPENKDFELSVKDGNNEQFIKTRHKSDASLDLKGKTDEEIKRIISEDMKKNGADVKPEDLKIERDEKGNVKVEVTSKQDSKGQKMENKIELKVK